MSRLSIRPRPLDIHKKIAIVKSIKEFEDDEVPRNSVVLRSEAEAEVMRISNFSFRVSNLLSWIKSWLLCFVPLDSM